MSLSRLAALAVLIAVAIDPRPAMQRSEALAGPAVPAHLSTSQRRALEALSSPTELRCKDQPLDRVLEYLSRLHRVEIELDRTSLGAARIGPETSVTESLRGITLRSALGLMLRDLGLDYVLSAGKIVVLSRKDAEERMYAAAYPVGDLVGSRAAAGSMKLDTIDLVTAIQEVIVPASWEGLDGDGLIRAVPPGESQFLSITNTAPVHHRIVDFLEHIRFTIRCRTGRVTASAERASPRLAAESRLWQALEQPAAEGLTLIEVPLQQAVAEIGSRHQLPIRIDFTALGVDGIDPDVPMTADLKGIPLGPALEEALRSLDLAWVVRNEVVLVTTEYLASERLLETRFYPVDDPPERRARSGLHHLSDDELIDIVTHNIDPCNWEDVGGPASLCVVRKGAFRSLVVSQSQRTHAEIKKLLAGLRLAAKGPAARQSDGTVHVPRPAERRILEALEKPATVEYIETPIEDLAMKLSNDHGIPIWLDRKAMEDVGLGPDAPITASLQSLTLKNTLAHVLRRLDLTWVAGEGMLLITTQEEAEMRLPTRVYPVTDVLPSSSGADFDWLIEVITSCVKPTTWDCVGGPGSVSPVPLGAEKALVVSQTPEVHAEIAGLLGALRRVTAEEPSSRKGPPASTWLAIRDPHGPVAKAEAKIAATLKKPCDLPSFIETPLGDAVDHCRQLLGLEVLVDERALEDWGIDTSTPITTPRMKDVSLGYGLGHLFKPLDLAYTVRDEALVVTTPEGEESAGILRVYPVGDLVGTPRHPDFDALIDLITGCVAPTTWDQVGGPGSIAPYTAARAHVLVVAQTYEVHERIARLLEHLRAGAGLVRPDTTAARQKPPPLERIEASLNHRVTVEAKEAPAADVLDLLRGQAGVPLLVDRRALKDAGVALESRVTLQCTDVTLRFALDKVAELLKLRWIVDREAILLTSKDGAARTLWTKVYRVDWARARGLAPGLASGDFDALRDALQEKIEPNSWDVVGGPGNIEGLAVGRAGLLVIFQTDVAHRKIAKLLGAPPQR